uniref:Uncharacterized protein n=1 Tax=Coccidioides posadasii RMSCC 3488 TaxID=454284 RepID=A0A0J6FW82_COCPO|nr:hypothetical protein CPAG_09763 [Coccidioides posadasii RMSCC 3488]
MIRTQCILVSQVQLGCNEAFSSLAVTIASVCRDYGKRRLTEEGEISQPWQAKLVIQKAAGWQMVESGMWKQWPGLAAVQLFHVKPKVGAKNSDAGKAVRKESQIRMKEEDGQVVGRRWFI